MFSSTAAAYQYHTACIHITSLKSAGPSQEFILHQHHMLLDAACLRDASAKNSKSSFFTATPVLRGRIESIVAYVILCWIHGYNTSFHSLVGNMM